MSCIFRFVERDETFWFEVIFDQTWKATSCNFPSLRTARNGLLALATLGVGAKYVTIDATRKSPEPPRVQDADAWIVVVYRKNGKFFFWQLTHPDEEAPVIMSLLYTSRKRMLADCAKLISALQNDNYVIEFQGPSTKAN